MNMNEYVKMLKPSDQKLSKHNQFEQKNIKIESKHY